MTRHDVRVLQRRMNDFTHRYLRGVTPIRVDGVVGPATHKRVRQCKWWLGYKAGSYNGTPDKEFRERIWHPKNPRYSSAVIVARGMKRRRASRHAWERNQAAGRRRGLTMLDGHYVAAWIATRALWCRAHGWRGYIVSGWRDPAYSEHLCYQRCGRPSCPGTCAGRSSNHVGKDPWAGAIDVTYYVDFGRIERGDPHTPRLVNALGSRDPVHFSYSGR